MGRGKVVSTSRKHHEKEEGSSEHGKLVGLGILFCRKSTAAELGEKGKIYPIIGNLSFVPNIDPQFQDCLGTGTIVDFTFSQNPADNSLFVQGSNVTKV